jgi:hypothetical protein
MEIEGSCFCPYCLQENIVLVDITEGMEQDLIEDCQVCCRPMRLRITVDPDATGAEVTAELP